MYLAAYFCSASCLFSFVWKSFLGRLLVLFCQFPVLILKEECPSNSYQQYRTCDNQCIHFLLTFVFSSFFPSFTQYKPYPKIIGVRMITVYRMIGSFISENMVESNRAVTIYLAISISHLPNSVFIGKDNLIVRHYQTFLAISHIFLLFALSYAFQFK